MGAELRFSSFLAGVLQPLLQSYQTDEPMALFLCNGIFSPFQQILQTVVKPDLLIHCKDFCDLIKLDLDKKTRLWSWKIWILGFLQLPRSKKQIRSTILRFHLFTMVLFNSFQLLQKNSLENTQFLQCGQKLSDLWSCHHVSGICGNSEIKA